MKYSSLRVQPIGLLAITGLLALTSSAFRVADTEPVTRLVALMQRFYVQARPEVSYLHLDQPAYAAGETLWFKAYVVDAQAHRPDSLSKVLYVDMVSPEQQIVFRRTLALRGGLSEGDIVLPDTLTQGVYTLRAYTSWMRNAGQELFFSRRVPVWQAVPPAAGETNASRTAAQARKIAKALQASAQPDVQFFPEGGDYVAGLQTMVGVKIVDATGHGLALRGVVLNDRDKEVTTFTTPTLGMSSFTLTPEPGRRYRAHVVLPDGSSADYPLPEVQSTGWVLNVREIGANYQVYVRHKGPATGTTAGGEALRVLAHVRGVPVYIGEGHINSGETFTASIPKAKLPAGIVHVTLFDAQGTAQAQRLAFAPEIQGLRVTLQPDKTAYGPRQEVKLAVEVRTVTGEPVPAELSLAVANVAGLPELGSSTSTIQSHLLLTSDLRGYVENPDYYFRTNTAATRRALDDLLLTQGWSRFVWSTLFTDTSPIATYDFPQEQALTISGQLVRPNGKPVPNGPLTVLEKKGRSVTESNANAAGYFLFTGFTGRDTAQVLVQARTEKGGSNVLIRLNELWPAPQPAWPVPFLPPATNPAPEVAAYGQRSRQQQVLERQYRPDTTSGIVLRNVTIRGHNIPVEDSRSIHGVASNVLRLREIPNAASYNNIFELIQGRVAGVQVSRSGAGYRMLIRGIGSVLGSSDPLYLLDGIRIADSEALINIPPAVIERVEILKGANAAIYGVDGANGVVAVFTKRGSDTDYLPALGVVVRRLPAFYRTREFYAPRYATATSSKPDPRATTLYWQPKVSVPASGRTTVRFYTADQGGAFRASVEGVSAGGKPAMGETQLLVSMQQ
ncbi:TonB-dependent receptor plug domain-containing protein [Hymenobacter mucosus]|uniref:TonB-dependent outer membrane receptor, SusC/RagA subfamily, signature region n=1 Tax=Hymenobacter mucosus TaxID=1411120 RepID=A0A238X5T6_9BACT|nr:TonB-dependent receptor plug domain-containing protein [Hymenobacter mucosus]SNR54425.1 TonB-dependent outer membrane receptor, SusC/RagA subfamily, signature region [Hymenobacter mucosus]